MIELQNVTVRTGPFVLSGLNLQVPGGCYAVLMGRTGTGKTTLLETICGLRAPVTGRILLHGRDVTALSPANRQVGYVPQDLALFPTLSVQEHLEFALKLRGCSRSQRQQRVDELAELLHLQPLLRRRVQGLSGGEAQRVALGRALSFHPQTLLLDEPLSALDEEIRLQMQGLLREIAGTTGVTVLHVTHHSEEARALGQRRFLLRDGHISSESAIPDEA